MPRIALRRINLLDIMLIVAGSAAGFALTRLDIQGGLLGRGGAANPALTVWGSINGWLNQGSVIVTNWLAVFSPILLIIRLRHPRPNRARVFRQPGALAALTASLVIAFGVVTWGGIFAIESGSLRFAWDKAAIFQIFAHIGPAIVITWTCMGLAQACCPEPSGTDRTGRCLGAAWIIVFLATTWTDIQSQVVATRLRRSSESLIQQLEGRLNDLLRSQEEDRQLESARSRQLVRDKRTRLQTLLDSGVSDPVKAYLEEQLRQVSQDANILENTWGNPVNKIEPKPIVIP